MASKAAQLQTTLSSLTPLGHEAPPPQSYHGVHHHHHHHHQLDHPQHQGHLLDHQNHGNFSVENLMTAQENSRENSPSGTFERYIFLLFY